MKELFLISTLTALCCILPPPSQAEIKVGVIVPLSGALAEYGVAIRNGIEIARSDDPNLFSGCGFQYEDSKYDSKTALGAFRKLTDTDEVSMVYNFGSPTSAAIAPVASKAKIPTLLWTTDPAVIIGNDYVIRFTNDADEFTKALTHYLHSRNLERLGIIVTENQYLNSILEGVRNNLSPGQSLTVIDTVQPTETDFRTMVAKLGKNSYDAIGVFLLSGQISQFYRQLRHQRISVSTFGTDFFESSTEIQSAEGGMDGAVYANNTVPSSFAGRYRSLYGNDLQLTYAGNGYDFAKLACSTLISGTSAETVMKALESSHKRNGILGDYNLVKTEAGDKFFRFPIAVKKIEGADFKDIR